MELTRQSSRAQMTETTPLQQPEPEPEPEPERQLGLPPRSGRVVSLASSRCSFRAALLSLAPAWLL